MLQKDETWLRLSHSRDHNTRLKTPTLLLTSRKSPQRGGATVLMTLCTSRSTKRKGALSRNLRDAMAWDVSYRQLTVKRSSVLYSRLNLNSMMTCWLRFHVWAAPASTQTLLNQAWAHAFTGQIRFVTRTYRDRSEPIYH